MFKRLFSIIVLILFSASNFAYAQVEQGQIEEPLTHFGQDVVLNGANIAWINFGFDVGTEESTAEELQDEFQKIASYGGNSARWWLHASGWFSPDINSDGFVRGISPSTQFGVSDQDVINQVREILDAAWEEGILLTISLFSYDIACSENNNINGSVFRGSRFDAMLNIHYESYFDNVLTPLVTELRDHPALFAWEIFNEADGMSTDGNFFENNCPLGSYPQTNETLQRFVNLAAARIHSIDPNVKVTTSVSQTSFLDQYTNDVLTNQEFSDPTGTLDFYQAHWYWNFGHPSNPYEVSAQARDLDRPIVLGEFEYGTEPATQTASENLISTLFAQGYAGAWLWDLLSLSDTEVETVISGASADTSPIDKDAVQACISSRDASCYTLLPGELPPVNIISGTQENDLLQGSNGSDVIDGGAGEDTLILAGNQADYTIVDNGDGTFTVTDNAGSDGTDIVSNIEFSQFLDGTVAFGVTEITLTNENDIFTGNAGVNIIAGLGGNDNLQGLAGDDILNGDAGDDIIDGGNGDDTIIGGAGDDTLRGSGNDDTIDGGAGVDSISAGIGNDTVRGGDGNDTILGQGNTDTLYGDGGSDTLRGGSGNDTLHGGDANDLLFGQGNNDILYGEAGNDNLSGAAGLDQLFGGAGNDVLNGGIGADHIDGGAGNDILNGGGTGGVDGARDIFVFAVGYEQDRINSFDQAGNDRIVLSDALWATNEGTLTSQQVVDMFGRLNATGSILTLDFGNGNILEVQNAAGIDMDTFGADILVI